MFDNNIVLLEDLIAYPQTDLITVRKHRKKNIVNIEVIGTNQKQLTEIFEETIDYIENKIVIPILNSDMDEMEHVFKKQLFPLTIKLKELNMIFIQTLSQQKKDDYSAIIDFEFTLYKGIKENILLNSNIDQEIQNKILKGIEILINYDISLMDLATNNKKTVSDIFNKININEVREYVSGSLLAFYCIGYILNNRRNEKQKLLKLMSLFQSNLESITIFRDFIEIMMEEECIQSLSPSEDNIEYINSNGFQVDLNKMEVGKQYIINYKTSQYLVKKDEKSDLSIYEVV